MLLLNECLLLLFISLSTQSGNFWIHHRIRIDIREIEWEVADWINLGQDGKSLRIFVNTVVKLLVPRKEGNFVTE